MTEIRRLQPHDPIPEDGASVVLLRRFDEDNPRTVLLEMIVRGKEGDVRLTQPVREDGTPMSVQEALRAARETADRGGLDAVYIIDRLAGEREREILRHHGDHTVNMSQLDDFDLEEGERGSDMRDRHP